jgi:prevent-host-death family protein
LTELLKRVSKGETIRITRRGVPIAKLVSDDESEPKRLDPLRLERAFDQLMGFARQHDLTEYDASYLELSVRESIPLATLDEGLRRAAKEAGIPLLA